MQCSQLPTALRLCLLSSNLASLMSSRFILLYVLSLMFGLVVGLWSCSQSALRTTVLCDVTAVCCVSCLHHYASGGTTALATAVCVEACDRAGLPALLAPLSWYLCFLGQLECFLGVASCFSVGCARHARRCIAMKLADGLGLAFAPRACLHRGWPAFVLRLRENRCGKHTHSS